MLGALRLERRTQTTLPTPTGSFAVGRVIDDWTDDEKLDTLAPVPGAKRELLIKGAGVSRLEISSPLYPEIEVLE